MPNTSGQRQKLSQDVIWQQEPGMPRYFFNRTDGSVDRDDEGSDLAGLDSARREAIRYLGETLKDHPEMAWDGGALKVEVTDESGMILFVVTAFITGAPLVTLRVPDGSPVD